MNIVIFDPIQAQPNTFRFSASNKTQSFAGSIVVKAGKAILNTFTDGQRDYSRSGLIKDFDPAKTHDLIKALFA